MERNEDKLVKKKAKELIKKHKRYIGEEVAQIAIEKLEDTTDKKENIQPKDSKEETENGIVHEKGKRGRPRRKA